MKYVEETTLFSCQGETLLGILAIPETSAETGVIVVVGGPQYRVGSHRQFVLLSRALASAGYAILRFDYRGMGDSEGHQRDFQSVSADIAAAINSLQARVPNAKTIVLWGLCDGASAALLYCTMTQDPRVTGLCLLNPWVRSEASLAKTQVKHYYTRRLMQKAFWGKLVRGKISVGALRGFFQRIRLTLSDPNQPATAQRFQERMAEAWCHFPGQILLVLSGEDYTAKEFWEYVNVATEWKNAMAHPRLVRCDAQGVDHTFSSAASRMTVEGRTLGWLRSWVAGSQVDTE